MNTLTVCMPLAKWRRPEPNRYVRTPRQARHTMMLHLEKRPQRIAQCIKGIQLTRDGECT